MNEDEAAVDFNEWSKQFDNAMESALDESMKPSSPPYPGRSPPGLPNSMNVIAQKLFSPGTKEPPKGSNRRTWRKNFRRKNSSKEQEQDVEMQDGFELNSEEDENSMEGTNQHSTNAEPKRFSPNLEVRRKRRVKAKGKGKTKSKGRSKAIPRPMRPTVPPPTPPRTSPPTSDLGEIGVGLLGLAKGIRNETVNPGLGGLSGLSQRNEAFHHAHKDEDENEEEGSAVEPAFDDDDDEEEVDEEEEEEGERAAKARRHGSGVSSFRDEKEMDVGVLGGLHNGAASTRGEAMTDEAEESPKFSLGSFNVLKKRLNRSLRTRNASSTSSSTSRSKSKPKPKPKSRAKAKSKSAAKAKVEAEAEVSKGLKLAREMMNAKEYGDALAVLNHALDLHVNTCVVLMHHALCSLKLQAFTQVVLDFDRIERSFEARTSSLLPSMLTLQYAGEALIRLGSHDLASAFLDRAKEALVSNPGVTGLKPSIYLSSIQSLSKENAEAQARVGSIDVELSGLNQSNVVRCADELLRVSPGSPRSHLVLILGNYVLGTADEAWAREQMKKALTPALNATGLLLVDLLRSQLGDAVSSCAKMLHRSGLMEEACGLLHVLGHALSDAVEGTVDCEEARLGCVEMKKSLMAQVEAYDVFSRAKKAANELFRRGDYSKSVELYGEAMRIDRTHKFFNSVMLCNRAAAYMAMNKFGMAEEDCSLALRHRARYVRARVRRARCRVALGKLEGAVNDFKMAYELDKDEDVLAELRRVELTQKARARSNSSSGAQYSRASTTGDGFSYSKYHERSKRFHSHSHSQSRSRSQRRAYEGHGHGESGAGEGDPFHNYYRYSKYTYYSSSTPRKEREKGSERRAPPWSASTERGKSGFDPYATLGVCSTDSTAVIRKAYLKLCLKYHPDKNPEGEEMYKQVQQAFDVLKDKATREEYDMKERMRRRHSTYGGSFS